MVVAVVVAIPAVTVIRSISTPANVRVIQNVAIAAAIRIKNVAAIVATVATTSFFSLLLLSFKFTLTNEF
jgi:hypothetical protein